MRNLILSESQNGNKYVYDINQKLLRNIDDVSYHIVRLAQENQIQLGQINTLFLKTNNIVISDNELERIKSSFSKLYTNSRTDALKTEITGDIIKYYLSNFPQIVFEVTEKCNLDCKYCTYGDFYNGHDSRTNHNLNIESAKRFLKYIYDFCNSSYSTSSKNIINIGFYGGEPLIRFDFIKSITLYAKELEQENVTFQFSMTTNATLLNKHIDFLVQNNFKLLISIDGDSNNHSYRVYKNGESSFDDVYNNTLFVKNHYPDFFSNNVKLNSVLHNRNSVFEINEFGKMNFGKNPMIAEISTDGLREDRKTELLSLFKNKNEDLKQSEDYFRLFHKENLSEVPDYKEAMYFIYNLSNLIYFNYSQLFLNQNKAVKPTGTCLPFARKIFITATGKILPCENVPHKFAFGSVSKDDININFGKLAQTYNMYLSKIKGICSNCYRVANCSQCMYYLNINDEHINCYGFMNKKEFSKYLCGIITYLENNPKIFWKIINETSLS